MGYLVHRTLVGNGGGWGGVRQLHTLNINYGYLGIPIILDVFGKVVDNLLKFCQTFWLR